VVHIDYVVIAGRFSAMRRQTRWGGRTSCFQTKSVNISKTVGDSPMLLLMTNRKLHMRFRLAPRSMILDDTDLYKFELTENFAGFN